MNEQLTLASAVRRAGEGEKYWFFGGGVWTWKVSSADGGGLAVIEVEMDGGKVTPLRTHPIPESPEWNMFYRYGEAPSLPTRE